MVSSIGLIHASLGILNLAAASFALVVLYRATIFGKTPLAVSLTNLAVNQLGYAIFCHLILAVPSRVNQHVVWSSSTACDFYGFLKTYFEASIFFSILLLCLERYMKTAQSSSYRAALYFKLAVGIWLYTGIWAILPIFGWGRYERKGFSCEMGISTNGSTGWKDFSYFITFVFAAFIVPSAVMFYLTARFRSRRSSIVWKVHRQDGLAYDSPAVGRVTACLVALVFILTSIKILLVFADLLPPVVTESGFYFDIFHPIVSHIYLFVGPIWYLLGVPNICSQFFTYGKRQVPARASVRFSTSTHDRKVNISEMSAASKSASPPLLPRTSRFK